MSTTHRHHQIVDQPDMLYPSQWAERSKRSDVPSRRASADCRLQTATAPVSWKMHRRNFAPKFVGRACNSIPRRPSSENDSSQLISSPSAPGNKAHNWVNHGKRRKLSTVAIVISCYRNNARQLGDVRRPCPHSDHKQTECAWANFSLRIRPTNWRENTT